MRDQSRGFTLVELLVVVGIIALLVAILVPAIQGARAVAKQTVCAGNLKQILYATRLYADDTNGRYPEYWVQDNPENFRWYQRLLPYMQLAEYDLDDPENTILGGGQFSCPEDSDPVDLSYYPQYPLGMYGLNFEIALEPTLEVSPGACIYGDAAALSIWPGTSSWAFDMDWDGDGKNDTSSRVVGSSESKIYIYGFFRPFRHPSGGNVAYPDSHVSPVTLDQWLDNYQDVWGWGQ